MTDNGQTNNQKKEHPLSIPAAIVVAGLIIAGVIWYSQRTPQRTPIAEQVLQQAPQQSPTSGSVDNIRPITAKDHILGSPSAPVKVVEFADTECPFCKRFHPTMHQAVRDYQGKVAWVYRHFPLDAIHPKARKESEATECAGELGGNEKFWAYTDRLYAVTPSNNNLDLAELPNIAEYVGLDKTKFEQCLASGTYAQHVADDLQDAISSGGQGTPYSIVIASNGKKFVISGAQPYAAVKSIIDIALAEQ